MKKIILVLLLILSMTIISCTRDNIPPTPYQIILEENQTCIDGYVMVGISYNNSLNIICKNLTTIS